MPPTLRHRKTLRHYDTPGHAHFLTFSCFRRLPLLSKDRTRLWFIAALDQARRTRHFDLWGWVIMPEHAHLLIWPREPDYRMAGVLASIKKPVGFRAIQYLEQQAPAFVERLTASHGERICHHFWQPDAGYDRNLTEPRAIYEVMDYIHANPVRRGLVGRPEEWPWSSAADWAGLPPPVPLRVDRTVPPLLEP